MVQPLQRWPLINRQQTAFRSTSLEMTSKFSDCDTTILHDQSPHLVNDIVISACWGSTGTRFAVYWWAAIFEAVVPLLYSCDAHSIVPVGSCKWFLLEYRQALGKIWCNIAAQLVPSFRNNSQSDGRSLHILTYHRLPATNAFCGPEKIRVLMNVSYTSPHIISLSKEGSHALFICARKLKVRCFLNTSCVLYFILF